jgi:hypothetical protein
MLTRMSEDVYPTLPTSERFGASDSRLVFRRDARRIGEARAQRPFKIIAKHHVAHVGRETWRQAAG